MYRIVNKPHADSKDHYVFEFDDVFAVDHPGEKGSCKNREPGYGVKSNRSKGKSDGKRNEKKLERNGDFEFDFLD